MSSCFNISEILEITKGTLLCGGISDDTYTISTDTRNISSENIFIPIVGEKFDGHDFIKSALLKGCSTYLVSKDNSDKLYDSNTTVIEVEDTLIAYLELASYYRKSVKPKVVAVTGSSGKTTTKEMLYSVISKHFKTHKSKLNHNNEIGLCQTLFSMPKDTEVLIVEMGMRGLGEINLLSKYAEPDIAVITNIGTAHVGRLGSVENIARAKLEITDYFNKKNILISHDEELVRKKLDKNLNVGYYSIKECSDVFQTPEGSCFKFENSSYKVNVSGEYNIVNSIAAIKVAQTLNIPNEIIEKGLEKYSPIDNRWNVINLQNNVIVVNDSYNASPDSVKAAIKAVCTSYNGFKVNLILGDMGELGELEDSLHEEIGTFLTDYDINKLITIGSKAKLIADNARSAKEELHVEKISTLNEDVIKYLNNIFKNAKEEVFLIKASRSMEFDKITKNIKGEF